MLFTKRTGPILAILFLLIMSFTSCTQQGEPDHAGSTDVQAQYDVTEGIAVAEDPLNGEQEEEITSFQCDYFGQKPPGNEPVIFAPGIVSVDNADAVGCTFSPDGKEFYFSRRTTGGGIWHADVMFSRHEANGWTDPEVAEFSKEYGAYEPHISPDGKRLYFNAVRPWPDSWGKTPPMRYKRDVGKIWFVERTDSGWGEPRILDRQANKDLMGISSTLEGTLYSSGIVRIRHENGQYLEPEWLGPPLNVMTPGGEHVGHPFIAPDESYIIFEDRPDRPGWALYLSFHLAGDRWSQPVNLAEIMNFPHTQALPMVTPDGKYLFFTSGKSIYWVSARFIEELRP